MECRYSYQFTERAEQDLDEILRYISVDLANPTAAQNLGRKIFEKIETVRFSPEVGSPVMNDFLLDKTVRKMLVDNYIFYYKVKSDEKTIVIIRIVYSKRNLDEILKAML